MIDKKNLKRKGKNKKQTKSTTVLSGMEAERLTKFVDGRLQKCDSAVTVIIMGLWC